MDASAHAVAPRSEPPGHGLQKDWPGSFWNLPGSHAVHSVKPCKMVAGVYRPAGHFLQLCSALSEEHASPSLYRPDAAHRSLLCSRHTPKQRPGLHNPVFLFPLRSQYFAKQLEAPDAHCGPSVSVTAANTAAACAPAPAIGASDASASFPPRAKMPSGSFVLSCLGCSCAPARIARPSSASALIAVGVKAGSASNPGRSRWSLTLEQCRD